MSAEDFVLDLGGGEEVGVWEASMRKGAIQLFANDGLESTSVYLTKEQALALADALIAHASA
jgi:hypothetical protein